MSYRFVATSVEGFVQQLATCYLSHGYYFFVQGRVPDGREPCKIDRKFLEKYGIVLTTGQRCYRKRLGLANVHYLRYAGTNEWVMVATHGRHLWWGDRRHPCPRRNQGEGRTVEVPILVPGILDSHPPGAVSSEVAWGIACPARSRSTGPRNDRARHIWYLRAEFLEAAAHSQRLPLGRRNSRDCRSSRTPRSGSSCSRSSGWSMSKRRAAGLDRLPGKIIRTERRIVKAFRPCLRGFRNKLESVVVD